MNKLDFKIKEIGINLKKIRLEKGFSQKEIEEKSNIGLNKLNRYEKGLINISISTLFGFASALEVTIFDLLGHDMKNNIVSPELAKEAAGFARIKKEPIEKLIDALDRAERLELENKELLKNAGIALIKRVDKIETNMEKNKSETAAELAELRIDAERCRELEVENKNLKEAIALVISGSHKISALKKIIKEKY